MDVVNKEAGEIGKRGGKGRKQAGRGRGKGNASMLPPVSFNPETMLAHFGTMAVKVSTVKEKDPLKNFAEMFAEQVVTCDPNINKRVMSLIHHDLVGFGKFYWALGSYPSYWREHLSFWWTSILSWLAHFTDLLLWRCGKSYSPSHRSRSPTLTRYISIAAPLANRRSCHLR